MSKLENIYSSIDTFTGIIKKFAQEELTCGCPDEVFEQIHVLRAEASPGTADLSVVIGEKLLVQFGDYTKLEPFDFEMPRLILTGITYRDTIGLNRLRIVLPGNVTAEHRAEIDVEIKKYDEKVHVHYMD